jgi:hypothetical protein
VRPIDASRAGVRPPNGRGTTARMNVVLTSGFSRAAGGKSIALPNSSHVFRQFT